MKVLFLLGNAAVVLEIFGFFNSKAIHRLRDVIFEEFAAFDCCGLIFTMMAFDMQSDWDYVAHMQNIFRQRNADTAFYFAELVASQEIRLKRNATENRLLHKASKRDNEESNRRLLRDDANHRCESLDGEVPFEHYIKIDNSHLAPEAAAKIIKDAFGL